MAIPDRSWTIAPTLVSFCACLVAGLWYFDGDLDAIADRLTHSREAPPPGAGPSFAPAQTVVAEADPPPAPPPLAPAGDRSKAGSLEDVCVEGTPAACKRWGMDAFYRSMTAAKQGKLGRALRVSWYGDSVIAGDTLPARLRSRLQQDVGDGGPGFVFVVPPHRFCLHEGIARPHLDGDWLLYAVSTQAHPDGLYGVGGAFTETYGGSTTLRLVHSRATQVELYYLEQKGGGTVAVSADSAEILRVDTKAAAKAPKYAAATVPSGAERIKIFAEKGRVRLFGIALENPTGAVVDNLGIVSQNVQNFGQRDPGHFAAELGHRSADLVMIMLGANEATWLSPRDQDTKAYQARYEKALDPVRAGRPDASCLVVSPTDQGEAVDGAYRSRPVMPMLVEAQRRAAHAKGCAFYSTYDWMGGRGSAVRWHRSGLVGGDFVHLSPRGAHRVADGVFDAFKAGFQRYAPVAAPASKPSEAGHVRP